MKQATTIEQQIEILKGRGMKFQDEQEAKEILRRIGYQRLRSYCFPFKKTGREVKERIREYVSGTYFEDIVELYRFDIDLRNILTKNLNIIEVCFRADLVYIVSNQYSEIPTWFVSPVVVSSSFLKTFEKDIYNSASIKDSPRMKEYHKKHPSEKFAPAWKTIEYMTFGNICHLYYHLREDKLRIDIAKEYDCKNEWVFRNYLKTIKHIRNTCAHGKCLYDICLPEHIKPNGPAGELKGRNTHNINGAIEVIKYFLGIISKEIMHNLGNDIQTLLLEGRASRVDNIIVKCSGLEPNSEKKDVKIICKLKI